MQHNKEVVYVCRDLGNGNGAEGVPFPTYVWAFTMPKEAENKRLQHKQNPRFSKLSKVEIWPRATLLEFYEDVGGIARGHYWRRK